MINNPGDDIHIILILDKLQFMKIVILSLLLLSIVVSVRPPSPYCRSAPLPSLIPVAVNSTVRFDLEDVFDGYNLEFTAPKQDNIDIVPKYQVNKKSFDRSYNFTAAKIKAHRRFLGLIINGDTSELVIGTSHDDSGVDVDLVVHIEDIPNLHCYDVDQIATRNRSYAVIDCATFRQGELVENHFLFVDLQTGVKVLGGKTTDALVKYNSLTKRNIEVIEDPMNRILYILRIIPRDGVDVEHQNNTYIQLFLIRDALDPQILDVIDYTFIGQKSLSIADYQVIFGQIYILAYNKGIYEISITRDQRLQVRSFFEIRMDMYRFKVDRLGFNDDLYIAITNGNQIYTYEWDVTNPPKIIQKFGLMANSHVQQLVCSTDFVIVTARTQFDGRMHRKHWIFSKRSSSYTHAFNVFDVPEYGPALMQWQGNDRTLHLFHEYDTYNIKISLPYLQINPAARSKAGTKQQYTVSAVSIGQNGQNITCSQKFTFLYQYPNDTGIIKTGLMDKLNITVDSPDEIELDLTRQFYGRNLTYNITFNVNSSILPKTYIDKVHEAIFNQIDGIEPENIVYFEMFEQTNSQQITPNSVYGLIQVIDQSSKNETRKTYTSHYIHCDVNVMDRDDTHHLRCKLVSTTRFAMGKIIMSSQMFDAHQRRLALVFDQALNTVFIYYFWQAGFGFYGRKDYAGGAWNTLTGVSISKGRLFCTLQNSKRIQIYNLDDLRQERDQPHNATAIFTINSQIMRFFGVDYWAPVSTKVSPFHDQVVFVKTKTGVMAINVNQMGFPELLFHIVTENIRYDFEVNHQNLLVIDQERSELYHLYTPLRRTAQPYFREQINHKFSLGQYDQVTADRLFYLVGLSDVVVINPYFTNTNAVYSQLHFPDLVLTIDSVNIKGRQILFVHTQKQIYAYVIRQTPKLYIKWPAHQHDFNMTLSAYNTLAQSQPYNFTFSVLQSNETEITPTQKFNQDQIKRIGHVKVRENDGKKQFTFNVTFNDTLWFQGNVFHYTINCTHCGPEKNIHINNHVQEVKQIVTGRAIYDMESTFNGIYAQQYNSYLKTWAHNDSIQYIQTIPTTHQGEVCSKIVIADSRQYVISLCETGNQVNIYLTSLISDKPFTLGPFPTQARAVNHAKIVDDILMIVDNQDDPLARNGGIYLYSLTFDDQVQISMIDLIDNDDLRIEGFNGMAFIGSADMHDSHGIQQYRIFITDSYSGNVFVFSFELTADRQEIVYLSKKIVDIKKYIPDHVKSPTRLKILTVNIHYYISYDQDNTVQYYLLFTISNWHHIELMLVIDRYDTIKTVRLLRMFERIPWQLANYFKLRRQWHKSQFAVPYIDYEHNRQVVAVYQADWIVQPLNQTQLEQVSSTTPDSLVEIPLSRILGVHRVMDTYEVAFAFHSRGLNTLLFTDMDGYNITQLQINQNISLIVKNIQQPDTINITAHNPYNNFTFTIQLQYIDEDEEQRQKQRQEIMWIVISAIGVIMIISLIFIWGKQKRTSQKSVKPEKQSLITVQDKYKEDYINRTSVDPESQRGTIDLGLSDSLLVRQTQKTQENIAIQSAPKVEQ